MTRIWLPALGSSSADPFQVLQKIQFLAPSSPSAAGVDDAAVAVSHELGVSSPPPGELTAAKIRNDGSSRLLEIFLEKHPD